MEDLKEIEKRIEIILKNFDSKNLLKKSDINRYYIGLHISYEEFIEKVEERIKTLDESKAVELTKILKDI